MLLRFLRMAKSELRFPSYFRNVTPTFFSNFFPTPTYPEQLTSGDPMHSCALINPHPPPHFAQRPRLLAPSESAYRIAMPQNAAGSSTIYALF
jgi:hypothetical protein